MRWMAVFALAVIAGCGGPSDDTVVVFAASSLTDAFTEIALAFETDTGTDVTLSFAGSSDLAAQIIEGAPGDVFASADTTNMAKVTAAGAISTPPRIFTTNRAAIVVESGNPTGIADLSDLADGDRLVVVCAEEVPCGSYTNQILERAGVDLVPASYEANVKAVVSKVLLGEADAGVVYATDVAAAGSTVEAISIAPEVNVTAEYPIAVLGNGAPGDHADPAAAPEFVDFVLGPTGQAILADHGFGMP